VLECWLEVLTFAIDHESSPTQVSDWPASRVKRVCLPCLVSQDSRDRDWLRHVAWARHACWCFTSIISSTSNNPTLPFPSLLLVPIGLHNLYLQVDFDPGYLISRSRPSSPNLSSFISSNHHIYCPAACTIEPTCMPVTRFNNWSIRREQHILHTLHSPGRRYRFLAYWFALGNLIFIITAERLSPQY
jgi:hypothetical protein